MKTPYVGSIDEFGVSNMTDFIAHCYYWGDTHIENFGYERARKISPAGSALKDGIMFTFHQDTPVVEPDMMRTVWCAVNRITKNGVVLGEDERIPVLEALKAVTINVARQYGEDITKGSIEPRKNADFIILSDDPLTSDPMKLSEIKVVKTYRAGKCIYDAA
jgi:predicted amidohydrolase YtcJ